MGGRGGRKIRSKASSTVKETVDKQKDEQTTGYNVPSSSGNQNGRPVDAVRRSERLRIMQKGTANAEQTDPLQGNEEKMIRESKHLLNIFPQEIWLKIAKFAGPETLKNLSNSSPFFRKILLPDRVCFLFPSVFKILGPKFECDEDEAYAEDGRYLQRQKINVSNYLPQYTILLKLRLVSSSWANAIDDYYQKHRIHFEMGHDQIDDIEIDYRGEGYYALGEFMYVFNLEVEPENFQLFIDKFEATHAQSDRSPFIARVVIFEVSDSDWRCYRRSHPEGQPEYFQEVGSGITNLLLKFGHHLWYCTVEVDGATSTTFYPMLREWLALMPNLKVLNITYQRQDEPEEERSELTQLEAEVENPLPKLDNLRFLKTDNLPTPIFNALLVSNDHISMLEVDRREIHSGYNIYTAPLPNLRKLSLTLCSPTDIEDLAAARVDWLLTTLYLPMKFENEAAVGFRLWSGIFEVVNEKFGAVETLTNLMLELPSVETTAERNKILMEISAVKLDVVHVTRLKLVLKTPCPLDFLLPMKESLQNLEIDIGVRFGGDQPGRIHNIPKSENVQAVQFLGFENNMMESNIWSVFPNLNKLRMKQGMLSDMYTCHHGELKVQALM